MADQAHTAPDVPVVMAGNSPDGLTRVHVAVLRNDREQVHALLKSRECAVDARSTTGATPLMLATLYGRTEIFFYLLRKKADLEKRDRQGFTAMTYAKGPLTQALVRKYEDVATGEPRRNGRRFLYLYLKASKRINKKGRTSHRRLSEARFSVSQPPITQDLRKQSFHRLFLRSGKRLLMMEARVITETEVDIELFRKSTGVIRSKMDQDTIYTFALSGWSGVNGQNVLCNKTYSDLARQVCRMYDFDLKGNWLDVRWKGAPEDKKGSYNSCHAEKQLAVWVLVKSLSQTLKTEELTVANVARLKEFSGQVPAQLREFLIELDHEPCQSCIQVNILDSTPWHEADTSQFLKLIYEKSGIQVNWKPRKWFVAGERPRLRYPDAPPVAGNTDNTDNTYVDEMDEAGSDKGSETMDEEDNAPVNGDLSGGNGPSAATQSLSAMRHMESLQDIPREPGDPYPKAGSPIIEPPQYKLPRWPPIFPLREMSPEWEVDNLLASRNIEGQQFFLVKWKNFAPGSCTWEPEEHLVNARGAIDRFKQAANASAADAMTEDAVDMLFE